jgi:UDP-2-acetamido-2-deoxy-ribo-hexuluronate aminotransferase
VVLKDSAVADDIRQLRNHGSKGAYRHERVGFNSRLDELQAGVLLIKFKHIEGYNEKRRRRAALYNSFLSDSIIAPLEMPGVKHVYHQYTVRSVKRDEIQKALRDNGISSVVYYPIPLHLQEAVSFLGYKKGDFPVAEETAEKVLSLPIYPELPEEAVKKIAAIINNV